MPELIVKDRIERLDDMNPTLPLPSDVSRKQADEHTDLFKVGNEAIIFLVCYIDKYSVIVHVRCRREKT